MLKEFSCMHKFHGGCVEKWMDINESCHVCRHKILVDDSDKKIRDAIGGRIREI